MATQQDISISERAGKALAASLAMRDEIPGQLGVDLAQSAEFIQLVVDREVGVELTKSFALTDEFDNPLEYQESSLRWLLGDVFRAGIIYAKLFNTCSLLDEDEYWKSR